MSSERVESMMMKVGKDEEESVIQNKRKSPTINGLVQDDKMNING